MAHNLRRIQDLIGPSVKIIAVLKANAYGHGIEQAAALLYSLGIRHFAVATLEEAVELRSFVPSGEILILGGIDPGDERACREYNLIPAMIDDRPPPPELRVHLLIDTGMTRLGIKWTHCSKWIESVGDQVVGVFSHFASAESDDQFCRLQLQRFEEATKGFKLFRHFANSAGIRFIDGRFEAVRPGLALYGINSGVSLRDLKPILSWKTRIVSVCQVPAGTQVGYNAGFIAKRDSLIGVLPVGYADGYSRNLSNCGVVKVRSQLAPVVGYVSMDLITVDLTDVKDVRREDEVTLVEAEEDSPLSALAIARTLQTIPYEILASIGNRVARIWKE